MKKTAIILLYLCQYNEKTDYGKIDQTSFNIQKSNFNPVVQWDQTMLISMQNYIKRNLYHEERETTLVCVAL